MDKLKEFVTRIPALEKVIKKEPTIWINPNKKMGEDAFKNIDIKLEDILDADKRLRRFAPLLIKYFEDTKKTNGIIESPLKSIEKMGNAIKEAGKFQGQLYLKMDSELAIAGSIKARGGIYEILYFAEQVAFKEGLLTVNDDYGRLENKKSRKIFSKYTIHVGSTGNLGLSIGITSATLGFNVVVHMSSDAKAWKKDLLKSKGATVVEYGGDFTQAVEQGRIEASKDPNGYFVDDENSITLFMGYAVAALRIKEQLKELNITVDKKNPAIFYLPCGVGGSPGGVTFGLKKVFGDNIHVFFVEPTNSPSMLIGMATGLHDEICVQDFGIDGKTEADGLAVGRASKFVGRIMDSLLSGIFTIDDKELFHYMRKLDTKEGIRIEPSACAAFEGPVKIYKYRETLNYFKDNHLDDKLQNITHIAWATGGKLVPDEIMEEYLNVYL